MWPPASFEHIFHIMSPSILNYKLQLNFPVSSDLESTNQTHHHGPSLVVSFGGSNSRSPSKCVPGWASQGEMWCLFPQAWRCWRHACNHPKSEIMHNSRMQSLRLQCTDEVGQGCSLEVCISNKLPGIGKASGLMDTGQACFQLCYFRAINAEAGGTLAFLGLQWVERLATNRTSVTIISFLSWRKRDFL